MSADRPERAAETAPERAEQDAPAVCYRHSDTPTALSCSRCGRPICGRCATPASVGQHCPECFGSARRSAPRVRSALRAQAPAVYVILAVNVVFYVLQFLTADRLTGELGLAPTEIAQGEWWRLLTPMVLHGHLLHIFFNSYVLYIYGPPVEEAFGTPRFVAVYVVTGFLASAASYMFSSCQILGVGASGAIFGVVGALVVFLYNRRTSTFTGQYLQGILLFIGVNLALGFIIPGIDNFAHLGGLAGGLLAGAGLDQGGKGSGASRAVQAATLVGLVGLGIAMVVYRTATFTCGPIG